MRSSQRILPRLLGTAVAVIALAGLATGCSSSSSSSSSASQTASATSTDAAFLTQVQAYLAQFYQGTGGSLPTTGPKAVRGKDVWVVSCGQATSCATGTAGVVTAGKALGWTTHVCDGASDVNNAFVTCLNQAIAAKASGIITNAIDCADIKQPLITAKADKIPVVNMAGFDCNQNLPQSAGPPLFAASVIPSAAYPTLEAFAAAAAKAQAYWLINATDGKAKVLNYDLTDITYGVVAQQATEAAFAQCSGCTVYNIPFTLQQYNPQDLKTLFQSAYLKHPDANTVDALSTSVFLSGVAEAIKATGKPLLSATQGTEAAAFDLVRSNGGISAIVGEDNAQAGWAAADTLNRLFAGQPPVPEGEGYQLVDATHNLPASGAYQTNVNYAAAYEKIWSGG
jgi:ribose transport system substrate-binding protein